MAYQCSKRQELVTLRCDHSTCVWHTDDPDNLNCGRYAMQNGATIGQVVGIPDGDVPERTRRIVDGLQRHLFFEKIASKRAKPYISFARCATCQRKAAHWLVVKYGDLRVRFCSAVCQAYKHPAVVATEVRANAPIREVLQAAERWGIAVQEKNSKPKRGVAAARQAELLGLPLDVFSHVQAFYAGRSVQVMGAEHPGYLLSRVLTENTS